MPLTSLQKAALLVIDVQRGLFCGDTPPCEGEQVVGRIVELAERARAAGAQVVYIQHQSTADGLVPETDEWQLHPRLCVMQGDLVIPKTTCDAFFGSSLEARLRQLGVETLVLTGYATDFCVDSTLRNAVSKGFGVLVAADAHTTSDGPVLKAQRVRQHHNWAWAECTTEKPVRVVPAAEIQFQ